MKIHMELELERRVRVSNRLRDAANGAFLRRWPRLYVAWPAVACQRILCWLDEHAPRPVDNDPEHDRCHYCDVPTPGQAARLESEDRHMLVPDEVEVPYDQDEEE